MPEELPSASVMRPSLAHWTRYSPAKRCAFATIMTTTPPTTTLYIAMKVTGAIVLAAACGAQAFVAPSAGVRSTQLSMTAQPVDRMAFLKSAATAAVVAVSVAAPALAEIDNPVVPFLGGGDKVDLNNANVRAYIKMPGMYPTVAGKIVSNGPYSTVADVYNIKGLSEKEKSVLKKYESRFVTLEPQVIYGIDRINNGLYR